MKPRIFKSLAFRLTLWYGGIFSLSSCLAFILFYSLISQTILQRLDQDLMDKAGTFSAVLSVKGLSGVRNLAVLESRAAGEKKVFFRLLYSSGEVFASSHMSYWKSIQVSNEAILRLVSGEKRLFDTLKLPPHDQRVRVLYTFIGSGVILQTGLSMETYSHFFMIFQRVFVGAMSIVVVLSALFGWFMSKKALSGVGRVTLTAGRISGASLDARVPETGDHDEVDLLARTFNRMLDRIQALVTSIREMSDNIAHDLKSPLTRIRGLAEITLVQGKEKREFQNMAASTIEEVDRLLDMINTMLVISRTDAGEGGFRFESADLAALVRDACDLFMPVAEDRAIELTVDAPGVCDVMVDRGMIQRAIANLLDNAVKYTPSGGKVSVSLKKREDHLEIRVRDTGVGIDPADRERIFERFFRVDPSRSEKGTGLGLSLARAVAGEHGGRISLETTPGGGTTFFLTLPYGDV